MLDFLEICTRHNRRSGCIDVYPEFLVKSRTNDLMIRGRDFYAVWDEATKMWSMDEQSVIDQVDAELEKAGQAIISEHPEANVQIKYMSKSGSGSIDKWHKYVQKQMRDSYHQLDNKIIFANTKTLKRDYASRRLTYDLCEMPTPAYDKLMSTLYEPEERDKLEWAIGAIISGDSKYIQKFIVLYGDAGSGKSTFLNIVEKLFDGYISRFNAKEIASGSSQFALESFRNNPLISIQHDGDLSRIEDNTKINSIVSHEEMTINEKFKSQYTSRFTTFLFMGTNKPVKITDSRSGIVRRLIDVKPSGNKIKPYREYKRLFDAIDGELGGIAYHCLDLYNRYGESYYDAYVPYEMIRVTNDFYDFMQEYYDEFTKNDSTDLATVWGLYQAYCDNANVKNKMQRRIVGNELLNYFREFKADTVIDGRHKRNVYLGFKKEKFEYQSTRQTLEAIPKKHPLGELKIQTSLFDIAYANCQAQYADEVSGTPRKKWADVTQVLSDINTMKLHWVKVDEHHIVIDFDLKDSEGNKSLNLNLAAAKQFLEATGLPPTYAELSRSGGGLHLHYIYDGDVSKLSRVFDDNIEVKVYTGNSSLRRQLTKCNDIQIRHINSGLPLKGDKKVISQNVLKSEEALRAFINKCLAKEHHGATKPEVDFIKAKLDEAYSDKSMHYDLTNMRPAVLSFAMNSTHNKDYCVDLVNKMHFCSEEPGESVDSEKSDIVFYDVEVFPNLFVVCWKIRGSESVIKMINPTASQIAELLKYRLVGFNNRRYDNHILYGRLVGFDNFQLYTLSQRIINGSKNAMFREAYNLSYTDIYDFCAKKQSLKKWEIELGIHHQELGLRWDEDVPEDLWEKVADYCINDVNATEAVFEANQGDFVAREILADLAGGTVNDTTNSLTTKIIFGNKKNPELVYTDLSIDFPGYEYVNGHNMYRGLDVGKGGLVISEPGQYRNVWSFDSLSHHPHSFIALRYAGDDTERFEMLLDTRAYIKHEDFESAGKMFDGRLKKYLEDKTQAKALSKALKIAINSVYGLTSANFDNPFRDKRNVNNIVALRGALFMVNLRDEVTKQGFKVVHIKTDSIKVVDPTEELFKFINEYAAKYGYEFEIEHKFEKFCLVNDAVYIAKLAEDDPEDPGKWTATGAQFAQPYVFKTLFSHEPIEFEDLCETKSVKTALYLDMNEGLPEGMHDYHFVGKVGQFCPIKEGCGGGILCRESDDGKMHSATGAKGYRWLESETVRLLNKQDDIDKSYYTKLVDQAVEDISVYGNFEEFISDKPAFEEPTYDIPDINSDDLPF